MFSTVNGFTGNAASAAHNASVTRQEDITFGAIHLQVTDVDKTIQFWTEVAGLTLRNRTAGAAELGTTYQTLVVVHQTATHAFRQRFSGLYHVAIHVADAAAFARQLYRLMALQYPHSPVDHTMSKSIYLTDPDGITIEFTLETPERFQAVTTAHGGLQVVDNRGQVRGVTEQLDVADVLRALPDGSTEVPHGPNTRVGHIHLYIQDVLINHQFYQRLGFSTFNLLPQFQYADLGAGGVYQHRVALNTWQSLRKPQAPTGTAGMLHFTLRYAAPEKLENVLHELRHYDKLDQGYRVTDPAGNTIVLQQA